MKVPSYRVGDIIFNYIGEIYTYNFFKVPLYPEKSHLYSIAHTTNIFQGSQHLTSLHSFVRQVVMVSVKW